MQSNLEALIAFHLSDARHRLDAIDHALRSGRVDHAAMHARQLHFTARVVHRGLQASHAIVARIQRGGIAVVPGPGTRGPGSQ